MSRAGLWGLLDDPELVGAVGGFLRRHPIATALIGGFVGAAAYAALTHTPAEAPPAAARSLAGWSHAPMRLAMVPTPAPAPGAIARHAREVRIWAYHVGQGRPLALVPADLVDDVERYLAAGGREPLGNADGAFPYDW